MDAYLIESKIFDDSRGYFMRANIRIRFVKDINSLSKKVGVIRGLHFQIHTKK
ncbi:dTDP-4-dehydrorhamnose 3,5-epimerase family protein [Paenibacillus turpanensis]|uniref:dTDP-4-dehydrorhamnose 3,5-epimerase family protein n=1 Tax=Paenibacillus turpanensis TaxID=2689078 RepID=UPI003C7C9537